MGGKPRSSAVVEARRDCIMKFFNAFARYMNNASGRQREVDKMSELLRRLGVKDFKIMREQIYRYHGLHKMDVQKARDCVKYLSSFLLNMRTGMDKCWLEKEGYKYLIDREHHQFAAKYWPRKMSAQDLDALDR